MVVGIPLRVGLRGGGHAGGVRAGGRDQKVVVVLALGAVRLLQVVGGPARGFGARGALGERTGHLVANLVGAFAAALETVGAQEVEACVVDLVVVERRLHGVDGLRAALLVPAD